ncbi:unnamed protein product [Durusdinium trenchii]|uniref:OTU domain-containing protein n=1 Tax=Durusdinium trenchii TaxID=1381693 RepID=A0ABP0KGX0_9DINO
MADTLLCQPPLLVFPEAFSHLTAKFFEEVNSTSKVVPLSVDSDRGEELAAFAHALQSEFPHMKRAAEYYYSLINPDRPRRPYAQLAFIEAGPSATTNLSSVELVFPQNEQCRAHLGEFMQGYRPSAEAIDCKFLPGKVNSTRKLESFAVGFVDGYTKEWTEDQLEHKDVSSMLLSFRWVRCCFTYRENSGTYFLQSLRALPAHLLGEWWVPGMTLRSEASKYAGKQQFKEILQTSGESSILFISRLIKDTAYAAKTAQVDEDGAIMLHDICLLWLWLRKKLEVKDEDDGSDSNNENELGDQEDDTDVRDDSIYGKRDGAITGVAVVYKEKNNIFLGTKGYKVGVVRDVIMSNKIELPNFPQYAPLVDALKGPADDTETRPAKKIKISSEETCGEDQISSLAKTKLSINGAADLITDEGGDCLFLASRAHNTFTAFREMLFDCNPKFVAVV